MQISGIMGINYTTNYLNRFEMQSDDGSVKTKIRNQEDADRLTDKSAVEGMDNTAQLRNTFGVGNDNKSEEGASDRGNRNSSDISGKNVIDYAVNRGLKTDASQIGRYASIDNIDVRKAVSSIQKDNILKEYQFFVQNPEEVDGSVRRIIR